MSSYFEEDKIIDITVEEFIELPDHVGHSVHIAGLVRLDIEQSSVDSIYRSMFAYVSRGRRGWVIHVFRGSLGCYQFDCRLLRVVEIETNFGPQSLPYTSYVTRRSPSSAFPLLLARPSLATEEHLLSCASSSRERTPPRVWFGVETTVKPSKKSPSADLPLSLLLFMEFSGEVKPPPATPIHGGMWWWVRIYKCWDVKIIEQTRPYVHDWDSTSAYLQTLDTQG
ncbi:hypothetical protein LXL04_038600 [Taraxacum kok-saghyz]